MYPASGSTTTTVTQNQTYNLSVTTSGTFNGIISVWIDYNFNGVYEPTEWQQVAVSNPPGNAATVPITIPGTSGTGLTGMRIRSRWSGNPNSSTSACITFGSGESEDYLITINPFTPPACAGTPGPFSAFASASTACSGSLINLTLNPNASTIFGGLTYQWQSAPAAAGPWTNIAGATNKIYSFNVTQTEWYRCIVVCTNSGLSSTSTTVSITVQPATWLGFTDDWNDPTNWCGRVPTLSDDALISLVASGRPAASYFFPVVAVGDTMLSKNLTVAATDSVTVLTDTTVNMNIAQSIHNNGRISINSSEADIYTFGSSVTTSGLLQAFRGGGTPDNIVQVIYTVSELQAAGMLPDDIIDSIYLSFYSRLSTAAYQNFSISYAQLPLAQDQFVSNDPLLGVTPVYTNPALIVSAPSNGVYTAYNATSGLLKLPATNFKWDGVSNILLQICYDMTAGTPGGNDFMYLSSTAPRKSMIWLGSTNIGTNGCSLTSLSPNLLSDFGQVPSTLRPNIGFRFRRSQILLNGAIGADLNNNGGAKFWSSFANLTIAGNLNNNSLVYVDTSVINLSGSFINNGTTDFSYTPLISNRKTVMNFSGSNWDNNGLFTSGNSLVRFNGTLAQNLGGTVNTIFHELQIIKGAASQFVTMLRNVSVNDTLTLTQGQLRLNLNTLDINNGLPSTTSTANPIGPITRTAGFLISENAGAYVNWKNIGTNNGLRVVPFGNGANAAPSYIPFSFQHSSGDLGNLSVSTYNAPGNLPWPPAVTHINNAVTAANNAAATVDRFWMVSKTGANPVVDLIFRFTPTERATGMGIFQQGRAQPWRSQAQTGGVNNAWIRLLTPWTSASYAQTYGQVSGVYDSVRVGGFDWPILPAQGAPFFAAAGPIGNSNPWAISINSQPLPVELISFDAKRIDESVKLTWSTVSEEASDYYFVERTLDFNEHAYVAKVEAAGYSNQLLNYDTWDHTPKDGINYYRLSQVDFDGAVNVISEYIPVRFGKDLKFEIMYMLNEPSSSLVFDYNSNESLQLSIFDISGRLVYQKLSTPGHVGINLLPLNLEFLSEGLYTIQLRNSLEVKSYRFVKQ
ncbi:MAG: T9SS type A sorting domain-containing protein [Bacteroidetes bacterium]|nr:T9SS type A sorting domain-containing protein [Bacteroidota bacterium]